MCVCDKFVTILVSLKTAQGKIETHINSDTEADIEEAPNFVEKWLKPRIFNSSETNSVSGISAKSIMLG